MSICSVFALSETLKLFVKSVNNSVEVTKLCQDRSVNLLIFLGVEKS